MSRPRSRQNQQLVENLYRKEDRRTGRVYYQYRDPRTGRFNGLGTDLDAAIADARALNAAIYAGIRAARLAAMASPESDSPPFKRVALRHLELCEKRRLAKNTLRTKTCLINAWERRLGPETPLADITVRDLMEVIGEYEADRPRMAQSMRSAAIDLWKDALAEGWAADNIAAKTRAPIVEVKRSRLLLDDFLAIHAAALTLDPWVARAMELALVTAQRREDVAAMEFRQTAGSTAWMADDRLWVIQQKTGVKVCLPLDLQIEGRRLADVVKACRDNIVSRWLVHHTRPRTLSRPGDQVWVDTISKGFARARDLAGVKGEPGKTPPTFHEIRSLAIRLYDGLHGKDFAQAIAGHKDAATTDVYRDSRGAEWVQVRVG